MFVDWKSVPPIEAGAVKRTLAQLALLITLERGILGIIVSYALGIGLFALIVPLTVQEIVNTYAFAIQPIMIITLTLVMAASLVFMGAFRVLQTRAVETLVQRLYTRIALAATKQLPRFRHESFVPRSINTFIEAEFLPRALVAMVADIVNVVIGGMVGMTILVMFHPFFLLFNMILVAGFLLILASLGQGGLRITLAVSERNYDVLNWLQDIAHNLLHFKATNSTELLLKKTDDLVRSYVKARQTRSDILTGRQYKGAVLWQALGHSALLGSAGWLLAVGQLTLGQFVAAEVIVGTLLLNMDTIARRMYALIYVFTSCRELSALFAQPVDEEPGRLSTPIPDPTVHGVRLTCKNLGFAYPNEPPVFEHVNLEVMPGERVAILSSSSRGKTTLALTLAGLYVPTDGLIRYNDVDIRHLGMNSLNACRGLVMDSHLSLFDGTLEENITMGRASTRYEDVRWALHFVELDGEVDALPEGLQTTVRARGKAFTTSQLLRILVARAVVTRPQLLIFDGMLHNMPPTLRETILRRLCSKDESWSVIFVSNDLTLSQHVDRRILID
jgi:ABC-type bacteriocin/lantibiotic exporter with double-glycine peptidase domain